MPPVGPTPLPFLPVQPSRTMAHPPGLPGAWGGTKSAEAQGFICSPGTIVGSSLRTLPPRASAFENPPTAHQKHRNLKMAFADVTLEIATKAKFHNITDVLKLFERHFCF